MLGAKKVCGGLLGKAERIETYIMGKEKPSRMLRAARCVDMLAHRYTLTPCVRIHMQEGPVPWSSIHRVWLPSRLSYPCPGLPAGIDESATLLGLHAWQYCTGREGMKEKEQ